jgi:hypothetical protein
MATLYSSRTCLPKFICSILVVGLFTAGVLITGAYPHPDLINQGFEFNNQTNSSTSKHNSDQAQNKTIASARLAEIQASNEALQAHLEQALAKIEQNVQKNKEFAERISRSPRAIITIQALEAGIAIFEWNNPEPEYQISKYATGNRHWRRAPSVHPLPTQIYLDMMSKTNTTKTGSWERKWRRSSNKIRNWRIKLPRNIERCQRSSRRTPSWLWSPKQLPHTCSSNITTEVRETPERRISPHGENHSSKRRSEDDDKSKSKDTKSESESESKNTEKESENKDIIPMVTKSKTIKIKRLQHNVTVRVDKVKAIKRTKNGIRIKPKKQLNKSRKPLALTQQIL